MEGNNKIRTAPDIMVVFGRPKGDRGSYKQWEEENIAPQVVFEILSPGNRLKEMIEEGGPSQEDRVSSRKLHGDSNPKQF